VQDAVFESGQERLAVVGHRVRFWTALRAEGRLIVVVRTSTHHGTVIIFPSIFIFANSVDMCALDKSHGARGPRSGRVQVRCGVCGCRSSGGAANELSDFAGAVHWDVFQSQTVARD
jgi:hypothetical protein